MTQTEVLLRGWRDFLQYQIAQFETTGAVHQLCTDPDLFIEWLVGEAQLQEATIESAVEQFIRTADWPAWTAEENAAEIIHMIHRALAARVVLDEVLSGRVKFDSISGRALDLANRTEMLRWLLIKLWNRDGPAYLEAWGADYLSRSPRPKSG